MDYTLDWVIKQCDDFNWSHKRFHNFVVACCSGKTHLTFFKRSRDSCSTHINITGCKGIHQLHKATKILIKVMAPLLKFECIGELEQLNGPISITVDNITAVYHPKERNANLNFDEVSSLLTAAGFSVRQNPETFSGLIVKDNSTSNPCTGIIYRTGTIVFMGARKAWQCQQLCNTILKAIAPIAPM